jgi:hypothetical protein
MNWNPYKRIADLERRVNEMHHEMLHLVASNSSRLRMLEQKMGRNTVLADFKDETVQTSGGLPTGLQGFGLRLYRAALYAEVV